VAGGIRLCPPIPPLHPFRLLPRSLEFVTENDFFFSWLCLSSPPLHSLPPGLCCSAEDPKRSQKVREVAFTSSSFFAISPFNRGFSARETAAGFSGSIFFTIALTTRPHQNLRLFDGVPLRLAAQVANKYATFFCSFSSPPS